MALDSKGNLWAFQRADAGKPQLFKFDPNYGISLEGVTLPALLELPETAGQLDADFLESLRADPDAFRALSSDECIDAYRNHGASIGDGVRLVNESGVEHADGDGFYIRNGIIIVPKSARIGEGVVV